MFDRHGVNGNAEVLPPGHGRILGAVAALARVREFDVEKTIDALGIQLGQIGGTMQVHEEGSPLLGMQLGFCTRSAVMSSDMAVAGISGARRILEGDYGYFALFEGGSDIERICGSRRGLADAVFRTNRFQAVARHGVIDGILTLRERHAIEASDVAPFAHLSLHSFIN